jgi:hypothetical protein
MQDWDRLVMLGVGVLVSIYTGYQGRTFWTQRKWLPLAGVGVLILASLLVPLALALFST